jgi:predicted enzyme related to lactoylglutathione lyase
MDIYAILLQEKCMLTHAPATTILPVVDMERARRFYQEKLGLQPEGVQPNGRYVFRCGGGATLALVPKPEGTRAAQHTALSFQVDDIETEIRDLESRGVVFADYDLPGLKTRNHVCVLSTEKAAWFRDPEGNILSLHEALGKKS